MSELERLLEFLVKWRWYRYSQQIDAKRSQFLVIGITPTVMEL
jgi:hypothetical protein